MEDRVYEVLSADTELGTLLGRTGRNRIYNSPVAPDPKEFPRITMFDAGEDDSVDGADNRPVYTEYHVRVDLWHDKDELKEIKNRVKIVLQDAIGADVSVGAKLYEPDAGIYHIPIDVLIYL